MTDILYMPLDLGVDGKIMLEWILGKYGERVWTGCIWLRIMVGSCVHGNETSSSTRGREFLD
jgi:hypothetical protein